MWKNTFLCRKDPFEIPGDIEPISDLFRASARQVPPLRNQTTGDFLEPPQVYCRSWFSFGVSQRLVEGWLSKIPRVLSAKAFFAAVTVTPGCATLAQQILTYLLLGQAIPKLEIHSAADGHQDRGRPGSISHTHKQPPRSGIYWNS